MIIRYQKFGFSIEAVDPLVLPPYKGSTFRGGFGNVFRKVVCAVKRADCRDCLLKSRCIYAYIFETFPEESAAIMNMGRYEAVPHPFIIEPPSEDKRFYEPGEVISFSLVLVGRAIDYLPYFIYTFDELGRVGIGKGRGRFILREVSCEGEAVYTAQDKTVRKVLPLAFSLDEELPAGSDNAQSVTLRFLTPLRIQYQRDLVVNPEFHILIRSLMRRLSLLHYFHCEQREPQWEQKRWIQEAEGISIKESSHRWWDWERYSGRQGVRMKLGGLMGDVTYEGNIAAFLLLLRAGEVLHLGKGTSFGLGRYEIKDQ